MTSSGDGGGRGVGRGRARRSGALAVLLALAGCLAIASTYGVLTQTNDEPAHIAAGMQLLDTGRYTYETQHPPLGRLAAALGPYLAGARSHGTAARPGDAPSTGPMFAEGNAILYGSGPYHRTLTLARLGILPFYLLLLATGWAWAGQLERPGGALLTPLFLATLPPLLGHAGLATTDMPVTALCCAALLALTRWLTQPTAGRAALLGLSCGLAIMAKFSAIPYLLASLVAALVYRLVLSRGQGEAWLGLRARDLTGWLLGLAIMLAVFWGCYGFSGAFGPASAAAQHGLLALPIYPSFVQQMVDGLRELARHNADGHRAFLLGQIADRGWWYYFPVALLFKTPLPFLGLGLAGLIILARRSWRSGRWSPAAPVLFFAAILGVSLLSHIDLGIRYVLVLYPLLALGAAAAVRAGLAALHRRWIRRAALGLLVAASAAPAIAGNPDYIAYFNVLAGDHPEQVLNDSNLDWGQDLDRLAAALRRRQIGALSLAYFGTADPARHGLPPFRALPLGQPATGWVAVSLFDVSLFPEQMAWLARYRPVARIGSIDLYWIPPEG